MRMKCAVGEVIGLNRQFKSDGGRIYLLIGEAFEEGTIELTDSQALKLAKALTKLAVKK